MLLALFYSNRNNRIIYYTLGFLSFIAKKSQVLFGVGLSFYCLLKGNITNTAQEEAEQLALYFQLAIEDLLNTVREYPASSASITLDTGIEAVNHGILYKVSGTATGLKVTTTQPRGGTFEVSFSFEPATAITTTNDLPLKSTTSYIVIYYDANLKVVKLTTGQ